MPLFHDADADPDQAVIFRGAVERTARLVPVDDLYSNSLKFRRVVRKTGSRDIRHRRAVEPHLAELLFDFWRQRVQHGGRICVKPSATDEVADLLLLVCATVSCC